MLATRTIELKTLAARQPLFVECVTSREAFRRLTSVWHCFALPSPMQSHAWLSHWFDAYSDAGRSLFVLLVRDGQGNLVAALPLYRKHRKFLDEFRLLGDGRACSDYGGLLLAKNTGSSPAAIANVLADHLANELTATRAELRFESVSLDDTPTKQLLEAFMERSEFCVARQTALGTCVVDLPDSFDEFLMQVSKNHRKRCRKWLREYFDSERAKITTIDTRAALPDAWQQLSVLHQQRRASIGDSGAFEHSQFRRFHEAACADLADTAHAEIRMLEIDGQLLAIENVLLNEHTTFAYQSGLSPAGYAISAGSLSCLAIIKRAIEQGHRQVDFLRGTEDYKFSWSATHRPAEDFVIQLSHPPRWLWTQAQSSLRLAKKLYHRI